VGDKVYILDHKGGGNDVMRALDAKTGKTLWETAYPDGGADAREGQARSTPAYDNGKLYTWSKGGKATCYNAADGKVVWQQFLKKDLGGQFPDFGYSSSPLVDGKQVIFVPGGNNGAGAVALDKETGGLIWKANNYGNPGYGTPMIFNFDGKKQYLIFFGSGVSSVDPATGKENWRYKWITSESCNGSGLVAVGTDCFIGISGYGHGTEMVRVKNDVPTQVWRASFATKICSPVVVNDLVFCLGESAELCCIDVKTGKEMWRQRGFSSGNWCSSLIAADGVLIVMNHLDSAIVLVEPTGAGYRELGRLPAPRKDTSVVAPALADKKLFVRAQRQLFCVDLDPEAQGLVAATPDARVAPAIPAAPAQPDLVVTDITMDPAKPAAGEAVVFRCTVKNLGTGPSPDGVIIGVSWQVDTTTVFTWADTETRALAPGATVVITANAGSAGKAWTAVAGKHTVEAYVDNIDRMMESREDNNKLATEFAIP
jgi:outer membrane protein assembly factor BamB